MFQKIVLIVGILLSGISVHAANVINPPVIKILKNKNHVQYKIFNHKSKFKFSKKQTGISDNNEFSNWFDWQMIIIENKPAVIIRT